MLGEYCITGVIGQGGFSVVYLAYEASLDRTVAIKEFFPAVLAHRSPGHSVAVVSLSNQPIFQAGLESFLREAKLQAKFFHPALVEVIRVWEQNSSAYIAMRYHRGQNLRDLKRSGADLSSEQILNFVKPILDALALLHAHDVIHRDVSPDNILIRETGEPVLLDLGAARTVVAGMTQALTTVLKPGYAPIEQYADDGTLEQGPWTDVYGIAAVVYFLYVGSAPPQAVTRVVSDSLERGELMAPIPSALRPVLRRALAVLPENRYRSIAEFRTALMQATDASVASGAVPEATGLGSRATIDGISDDQDDSTVVMPARARKPATLSAESPTRIPPPNSTLTSTASTTSPLSSSPPQQARPHPPSADAAPASEPERASALPSTAPNAPAAGRTPNRRQLQYGAAALALVAAASFWVWSSRSPPAVSASGARVAKSPVAPAERPANRQPAKPATDSGPDAINLASANAPAKTGIEPASPLTTSVPPQPALPAVAPVAVAPPARRQSDESSVWNRATKSRSAFDLMAYLGKYPAGEHAAAAHKSLLKAQRSTEGCLLRYPHVRTFAWSGKCSDGLAVGAGVLKWVTQSDSVSSIDGRGTLNNGIMVGRWIFDVSHSLPGPQSVVNRTIDFDSLGNVSRLQRHTLKDGGLFVGETNASIENYFGAAHGPGVFTHGNGDEYRGPYVNGKRHGKGIHTYKANARFKRLTGHWIDGQVDGAGTLEFIDGTALSGHFKGGKSGFDGPVKKLRANGSVAETQVWRDGKPEGSDVSPIKGF